MSDESRQVIDGGFIPTRAEQTYTVELDGEAVVLDESEQRLHLLNHTATLLWTLFDGHATLDELAHEITTELTLPFATVHDDVLRVVRQLAEEGLIAGVRSNDAGERRR